MNKTALIIAREYLTHVKKKSFVVLTILLPILMAALIIVPVYITNKSEKMARVLVVDDNDFFINRLSDTKKVTFYYQSGDVQQLKRLCIGETARFDAVLHILDGSQSNKANLYYFSTPSMNLRHTIEQQMNELLFDRALRDSFNIDAATFNQLKQTSEASVAMLQIDENGIEKVSFTELNRVIGIICGFLIYMFIFMFASQVLRSVLEEKTSRIVEVLISSVKPMQLMVGKIVGVALVGFTQFFLWVLLTVTILFGTQIANPDFFSNQELLPVETAQTSVNQELSLQTTNIFNDISNFYTFSFTTLILAFIFFFVIGYLTYSALFAAVGSAADNETDSQQLILPVTIPLLLTIVLVMPIAAAPHGQLAWWFSMIPLTSPIAMLVRIPSGVPMSELLLSMGISLLFLIFVVWVAARIYRNCILMYGKKLSYRDLFRWIRR